MRVPNYLLCFSDKTGPNFVTCEIKIMPITDYLENANYLPIIKVYKNEALKCLVLTYCTKLRYRRDILQRFRMLTAEHCRHKAREAVKERSQD
jgi:hypothetical protein